MKLARFAFGFALGTLISRILGFLRDAGIAYFFGASHVSDAFFVAFRIPNTFRRLLGEGGFNAAFVPLYTRAVEEGRDKEFLKKVLGLYVAVNLSVTLLGVLLSEYIVSLIAPGLRSKETFSLAVFMAKFLFLYLFLIGLSALFMGIMNVRGRFFIPAVSQAVFNALFLGVLLLSAERFGHIALIAGVLVGGVAQVLTYLPYLLRDRVPLSVGFKLDEEVKTLLKRLLPALGGFGVGQLSVFIDTFLASFLRTGSISYLYYANRLYQLPFGVISVGVANSLLSLLSKKDIDRRKELTNAFRLITILTVPASAGLFLLSEEIVRVIYFRGNFTEEDVFYSSLSLSLYSLGLPLFSLQKVLSSSFFSKGDTKTPVKASLFTVLSEGLLAASLAFILGLGVFGLPAGTALSSLIGFTYLLVRSEETPFWNTFLKTFLKVFLSTGVMVLFLLFLKNLSGNYLVTVLIAVPTGALVYFLSLSVLREDLTLSLGKSFVKKLLNP